jgi:hypothetical protein
VHSNLPDDLGIQYNSFGEHHVVAKDEHISVLPGLGHTGSSPFDERNGWYRAFRGPCGSLQYTVKWRRWSMVQHKSFPPSFRAAVRALLLCRNSIEHHPAAAAESASSVASGGSASAAAMDDGDYSITSSSSRKRSASQTSVSPKMSTSVMSDDATIVHAKLPPDQSIQSQNSSLQTMMSPGTALSSLNFQSPAVFRTLASSSLPTPNPNYISGSLRELWQVHPSSQNSHSYFCSKYALENRFSNISIRSLPVSIIYYIFEFMVRCVLCIVGFLLLFTETCIMNFVLCVSTMTGFWMLI